MCGSQLHPQKIKKYIFKYYILKNNFINNTFQKKKKILMIAYSNSFFSLMQW